MKLQLNLKSKVLPSLANFNSGIEFMRIEITTNTNILKKATTINMDSVNNLVLEKQEHNCLMDYKRMLSETIKEVVKPDYNN